MKFKNIISVFTSLVITISCCMTPQTTIAENKYEDMKDEKYIAPSIITNMKRFAVELLNEKAYNNIID